MPLPSFFSEKLAEALYDMSAARLESSARPKIAACGGIDQTPWYPHVFQHNPSEHIDPPTYQDLLSWYISDVFCTQLRNRAPILYHVGAVGKEAYGNLRRAVHHGAVHLPKRLAIEIGKQSNMLNSLVTIKA